MVRTQCHLRPETRRAHRLPVRWARSQQRERPLPPSLTLPAWTAGALNTSKSFS